MIGGAGIMLGGFRVSLGLDTDDYAAGIINADSMNRVFGEGVSAFIANPLLGATSMLQSAGKALIGHSARVLESAEAHERLAQRLDVSVELLQALQGRAEQAGFGMQIAEQGLKTLVQRLGEARQGMPEAVRAFEQLGIQVDSIGNTDEALAAVLDAMAQMPTQAQAAAVGAKLFGEEAGTKLANTVGGGTEAIRRMIAEQRALGQVLDGSTVSSLAGFNTTLGKTQQLLGGTRDVLLANFLAGFIDEVDGGNVALEDLGVTIQEKFIPAARELGEMVGEIVGNLDELIDRVETVVDKVDQDFLSDLVDGISTVVDGIQFIDRYTSGLARRGIGAAYSTITGYGD